MLSSPFNDVTLENEGQVMILGGIVLKLLEWKLKKMKALVYDLSSIRPNEYIDVAALCY